MTIHTVLGPIEPDELGPTSMHEHLLSDLRVWSKPSAEPPPGEPVWVTASGGHHDQPTGPADGPPSAPLKVHPRMLGYLRWNALSVPDNLVLEDPEDTIDELRAVYAAGGRAVVDLTLVGMGRRLAELPRISRESGVAICIGCGWYVEELHPPEINGLSVEELAVLLLADLRDGVDGSGIRPALIGEIGTNHPPTEAEWRNVRAAGRAGAESGAAVNVHLSFRGADGVDVLQALVEEGMPPDRCILSHMDERLDRGYHREVAQAGAILEYDTFGSDFLYGTPRLRNPSDVERLEMAVWLLSEGFADQLVLACDTWTKANLRRNGGYGYEHLFRRIVPALQDLAGADDATMEMIMVRTPRRLLDR